MIIQGCFDLYSTSYTKNISLCICKEVHSRVVLLSIHINSIYGVKQPFPGSALGWVTQVFLVIVSTLVQGLFYETFPFNEVFNIAGDWNS